MNRACLEINLENLENNINEIKKLINKNTKIMAVVKANAYGHGANIIATKLNQIGIEDFAVATVSEGIELRKNKITGNILILGYTSLEYIKDVVEYDLIQSIVDYNYAQRLNELNLEVRCHLAINTGMNRIGEEYTNLDKIYQIYAMKNLKIEGIFSHLCVADSNSEEDIEFTKTQIERLKSVVKHLKENNINPGKVHIQSSFGTINYKDLGFDYVRPGIILYGVYGSKNPYINTKINLKQVLTLKAQITSVRNIKKNETISYGRTFKADDDMKIASVSIGYADGYPRSLSNKNTKVLVNGKLVPILGRICMDQLMIDVSEVPDVKQEDEVILIGNANKEIMLDNVADNAGMISYELISRLANRVERKNI